MQQTNEICHNSHSGCSGTTGWLTAIAAAVIAVDGIDNESRDADADLGMCLPPGSDRQRSVTTPAERSFRSRATAGTLGADLDGASVGRNGPSLSRSSLSLSSDASESAAEMQYAVLVMHARFNAWSHQNTKGVFWRPQLL